MGVGDIITTHSHRTHGNLSLTDWQRQWKANDHDDDVRYDDNDDDHYDDYDDDDYDDDDCYKNSDSWVSDGPYKPRSHLALKRDLSCPFTKPTEEICQQDEALDQTLNMYIWISLLWGSH